MTNLQTPRNVTPEERPTEAPPREESYIHFLARESQRFLEIMIVVSLIMTVLLMVTFFFFALIPVAVLLLSYGLLVLATAVEQHTTPAEVREEAEATAETRMPLSSAKPGLPKRRSWLRITNDAALRVRLTRVTVEVVIGAALLAIVMAATVLPVELIVLGVGVLFAYILLLSSPMWIAWLNDETSFEEQRQTRLDGRG